MLIAMYSHTSDTDTDTQMYLLFMQIFCHRQIGGKAFAAASCDCRLLEFLERCKYAWQIAYRL